MRDFRDAKTMARSLREALAAKTISISHGESLEIVSRMFGTPDWNTLSALIKNSLGEDAAEVFAEETPASPPTPDDRARMLAEQQAPRAAVPFDPARFDRFVGPYELRPTVVITVTRQEERFCAQFAGQEPTEFYPESQTKFFATTVAAQISFVTDPRGDVIALVLHQNGREQHARRIDERAAGRAAEALAQRITANEPAPGTEAALRRHIQPMATGEPDFDVMAPALAETARARWADMKPAQRALGALKSINFVRVGPGGWDEYEAQFEHGAWTWMISPLGPDGRTSGLYGQPAA